MSVMRAPPALHQADPGQPRVGDDALEGPAAPHRSRPARGALDRRVAGRVGDPAAVDPAEAQQLAVAHRAVLFAGHAGVDQRAEGHVRPRVEQQVHTLARRQEAAIVLALHALGTAQARRGRAAPGELRDAALDRGLRHRRLLVAVPRPEAPVYPAPPTSVEGGGRRGRPGPVHIGARASERSEDIAAEGVRGLPMRDWILFSASAGRPGEGPCGQKPPCFLAILPGHAGAGEVVGLHRLASEREILQNLARSFTKFHDLSRSFAFFRVLSRSFRRSAESAEGRRVDPRTRDMRSMNTG